MLNTNELEKDAEADEHEKVPGGGGVESTLFQKSFSLNVEMFNILYIILGLVGLDSSYPTSCFSKASMRTVDPKNRNLDAAVYDMFIQFSYNFCAFYFCCYDLLCV